GPPRSQAARWHRARARGPRRGRREGWVRDAAAPWVRSASVLRVRVEECPAALAFLLVDATLGRVPRVRGVRLDGDERLRLDLHGDPDVGRLDDAVVERVEEDEGALLGRRARLHDLVLADVLEHALEPLVLRDGLARASGVGDPGEERRAPRLADRADPAVVLRVVLS